MSALRHRPITPTAAAPTAIAATPTTPARMLQRLVLLLVLALLMGSLQTVLEPPRALAAGDSDREADFVALTNMERAKEGLPALTVSSEIRDVARRHSRTMADRADLHHNPDFSSQITNWRVVAENVGRGPSVESIHRALMASDGHRANILNERVTEIGIGVVVAGGQVWVTQNFRLPHGEAAVNTVANTEFGDVSSTNVHIEGILAVTANGIAEGCGLARFCPADAVTRADFAVMLAKAMDVDPADTSRFTDMVQPRAGYAEALAARGVVAGLDATTFAPDRSLSREQLATMFAQALDLTPQPSDFADVTATHDGNVGALAARGIVNGCEEGLFCPRAQVTRAQVASMLTAEFG